MFTAKTTLAWLFLYAIAMANIEAAIVVHLRSLYYPDNPLEIFPLNLMAHGDLAIELSRELATVVMIIAVAVLAERQIVRRFAAFVLVFGVWDIFYYAWLKVMIGWPVSWGEWDVLFLIPWPWLGPWIAPVLIAVLFTAWGCRILLASHEYLFSRSQLILFVIGALLGLTSFLLPAAGLLANGEQAFQGYQPGTFNWALFAAGFMLMAIALYRVTKNKPL